MTRPFSTSQKFRILVRFDAQIIIDGHLVPVSQYAYGTMSDTKRFGMLRRLDCAVRCACGCDTWAPLWSIDFDHETPHVQTQRSLVSDGRPLRRTPCHHAKNAVEQKVTGKVTRVRNKLSVTTGLREDDSSLQGDSYPKTRTSRRSWPQRSFPKSSRPIPSRGFQKRWEPRT